MSPQFDGIEACVFDAYGTLFDVNAAAYRCRDDLGDTAQPLAQIWRDKQLQYTWLRTLMGEYADFWQVTGDALDFAFDALGLNDDALKSKLMNLYRQLDAYAEVPAMLRTLKDAGIKTAILSNGSPDMLGAAVTSAGIGDHLDKVLSVDALRLYKTRPEVYQMAVDELAVAAGNICFMSSNGWDASGAAVFGFRVIWVNRTGQPGERLPGKPELMIDDLTSLPSLIGAG